MELLRAEGAALEERAMRQQAERPSDLAAAAGARLKRAYRMSSGGGVPWLVGTPHLGQSRVIAGKRATRRAMGGGRARELVQAARARALLVRQLLWRRRAGEGFRLINPSQY